MSSRVPTRTGFPAPLLKPHEIFEKGWLRIDFDAYEVWVDGRPVTLFLREFEILRALVRAPNRVLSRQQILDVVWDGRRNVDPRTVDVHIRRLREHLGVVGENADLITTVRGVGYKFNDRALAAEPPRPQPSLPA